MGGFSIAANVASIFGLFLTIVGNSTINPYIFIVGIAITSLAVMLLLAYSRDDRMRDQIIQEMGERFGNLGEEHIEDLPEDIQELRDEIADIKNRVDELEKCCDEVKKRLNEQ
jgi:peptidoglycan hydrolase CwlO-like protein